MASTSTSARLTAVVDSFGARLTKRQALARDAAVVSGVAILGVMLALQGWRSRVPGVNWISSIDAARALLTLGRLPDHGVVTSLNSYAPPGLAWIVVPGASLFSDPRLLEVPGNAVLYLGTLIGIFVLARACCGVRCALLAVLLYGVSERGLMFAASYAPAGHPFFYVWMAYWTCQWVALRDSRYLGAALLTWLAGMYVFMAVAPAAFILPVVWVFYRPPLRLRPLLLAGCLALLLWYPYLRFEAARGFADIRSQVLVQTLETGNDANDWCESPLTVREWGGPSAGPAAGRIVRGRASNFVIGSGRRVLAIARGLVANFEGLVPGAGLALLALTLAGLLALSARQRRAPAEENAAGTPVGASRLWQAVLASGLILGGGLANEFTVSRFVSRGLEPFEVSILRTLQALAALGGIALLMRRPIARFVRTLADPVDPSPCDRRVLVLALVVPWVVLLLIAESGRQDRLVGLWALQVIVLAFFSGAASARAGNAARFARWAGPLLVTGIVLANPFVQSRVAAWRHDGWSGTDADEIRVADYLSTLLRAEGRDRAAIGRQMFLESPLPEPPWRWVDARWRDGENFDVFLDSRHGISNLNQCGEGVSRQDEYRIVEAHPPQLRPAYFLDVQSAGPFYFLARIGGYEVYKRDP